MKQFVIDASFSGAWLLPDEQSSQAEKLLVKALRQEAELAVPDLWNYEILNLLVVAIRRERIPDSQLPRALDLIRQIPLTFYDHGTPLTRSRTASLAERFRLSAYDAAYLELADRLQVPLRSLDEKLMRAADQLKLS